MSVDMAWSESPFRLYGQSNRCWPGGVCYSPPAFMGRFMSQDSDFQHGSMDISGHQRSYAGFLSFTKWSLIGILLIMVLLAIFRTHS
jgi:hypothetical protein